MPAGRARHWIERGLQMALAALVWLVLCAPLAAQCAMCRESAAFQRAAAINSLMHGIIVLAIPPVAIAVAIGCFTYRHRGAPEQDDKRQRTSSR